jgi:hypothetical protein
MGYGSWAYEPLRCSPWRMAARNSIATTDDLSQLIATFMGDYHLGNSPWYFHTLLWKK